MEVTEPTQRRVIFEQRFDWSPPEHKGRVSIAYKPGMHLLVREDCAVAAIAAGRARDPMKVTEGPIRLRAKTSWRNEDFEGEVFVGDEFSTTEARARDIVPRLAERIEWKSSSVVIEQPRTRLHLPILIVIPAYKEHYVNYATRYVIPSVKQALAARHSDLMPHFLVHTDMPARFEKALDGYPVTIKKVASESGFKGLTAAHRDAIASAPVGAIVVLLNADIMVSREAFAIADLIFAKGFKAIASIGMRSLIQKEEPPIGASAKDLLAWSWRNRHRIAEDGVWGRGKTRTPTTIFFEQDDNVVVHCFHLHPFMVHKDRPLEFKGTIDDDLLARYKDDEVYVVRDAEIGFAELSWKEKTQSTGTPLTEQSIVEAGRSYIPAHIRNFRNQIRVTGDGPVDTTIAHRIADGVAKRWNR